jgi:hypothetical protein
MAVCSGVCVCVQEGRGARGVCAVHIRFRQNYSSGFILAELEQTDRYDHTHMRSFLRVLQRTPSKQFNFLIPHEGNRKRTVSVSGRRDMI